MSSSQKVIVAPSILAADPGRYEAEMKSAEDAGADWLHIDVMDGSFVPPITFGTNIVETAKKSCTLFRDVHLMIRNPDNHLEAFAAAGSQRLIVHEEACSHLHRTVSSIKKLGVSSGVALNPGTPVTTVYDVLEICDLVLIMTVNPGWGGQKFIETCISKIETLRNEIARRNLPTIIEVDGGINAETGKRCVSAGARALVAGSAIFGEKDRAAIVKKLHALA